MQFSKIFLALMASSTLVLTGCGGSSSGSDSENPGTPSAGDNNPGNDESGDNTSGDNTSGDNSPGDSSTGDDSSANLPQTSWSTPESLADGSVTVNNLHLSGAANKPILLYSNGGQLMAREFDGSNWDSGTQFGSYSGVSNTTLATNANGKAVVADTYMNRNAWTHYTECHIRYFRYDGTNWLNYHFRPRSLTQSGADYSCNNIDNLLVDLSDDGRVSLSFWRTDNNTGRLLSCDGSDSCLTTNTTPATSVGAKEIVSLGSANDGDSQILLLDSDDASSFSSSLYMSTLTDGVLGSQSVLPGSSGATGTGAATMAVNDANHALVLYIDGNTLESSFNNGAGFAASVNLDTNLSASAPIRNYLSSGADYGLSIWEKNNSLFTSISDAGSFGSATQNTNSHSYITGATGTINDNGKAVIVWVGYDDAPAGSSVSAGTLYSRFYDGSQWLAVQTIDSGINVENYQIIKGGLGVYLDNSDDVTVAYTAYKDGQANNEPQLFFSRRVID
ncbi:MAG: hypothetical protein KYX62_11905 [Pseudomonadota bacterium]|nr:hypothetical protein [Pseudomonadota bacterium]